MLLWTCRLVVVYVEYAVAVDVDFETVGFPHAVEYNLPKPDSVFYLADLGECCCSLLQTCRLVVIVNVKYAVDFEL